MLVGGHTFDLDDLVVPEGLSVQLSNIFLILQKQAQEIQASKGQIDLLKSRFSEVEVVTKGEKLSEQATQTRRRGGVGWGGLGWRGERWSGG